MTDLERLLGLEDFAQGLAGLDTESVALEPCLFHILALDKRLEVRLDVGGGVELQASAFEGEQGSGHDHCFFGEREKTRQAQAKRWGVGVSKVCV